jgi:hypothetical protein
MFALLVLAALATAGAVVETLDRRIYEGELSLGEGGHVRIRSTNGSIESVALAQVRVARFQPLSASDRRLPRGWSAEDVGQLQGSSGEEAGLLTLALEGGGVKDSKQQSAHFVHRVLRGDGEVVARVRSVEGTNPCMAGVMMRENLDPAGGFILLGVTPAGRLRLDIRELGWHPLFLRDLGEVKLPLWLKLARRESDKTVFAFRSADGQHWVEVAQRSLGCPTEQFPDGSDYWRSKFFVGVAMTASNAATTATARLDQMAVTARGLLGEYYADSRFHTLQFARPDGKVEFNWGLGSPAPDIEPDHFGVRWTGQLEPRYSEDYMFHLDADNDGWLWINGQEVSTAGFKKAGQGRALPLQAGKQYELKLEFKEGAGEASVKLGWSSRSQRLEVIPASQISYTYQARSPNENGEPDEPATNALPAKGLWLRNGSILTGPIRFMDDAATRLNFAGQREFPIPNAKVARLVFRTPPRSAWLETAKDRRGLIMKNGDFLECEPVGLDKGTLTVRSLLFGSRTFLLDRGDVIALLLHPCLETPAPFEVRLLNRSVLRVKSLRSAGEAVLAEDTTLGEVAIPARELVEIRNLSAAPSLGRGRRQP